MTSGSRNLGKSARFWRAIVLLGAWAVALTGCQGSSATHAGVDTNCIPGTVVFCNCTGGLESGTQQCLAGGQGFGPCEPCLVPVVEDSGGTEVSEEPDVPEADELGSDAAGTDASADVDAGPVLGEGKCPGPLLTLDGDHDIELTASTAKTLANTAGEGPCVAGSGSHDAAFVIQAAVRGRLSVGIAAIGSFDPMVYLRAGTCGGVQLACSDATGVGSSEAIEVFARPDQPLHLFVDGKPGQSGTFQLQLHLEPGIFCGDGVVDPDEACDDGNTKAGDGCSPKCQPDGYPSDAATCPGQPIHLWSLPVEVSATTVKFANTYKASCGGGGGRDAVYQVVAHRSGQLVASINSADFDTVVYVRNATCTTGKELACSNTVKGLGGDTVFTPVETGQTVFVFVDGYKYGKGTFHLDLRID
jgi:cysteine-rich repeat protein